MGILLIGGAGFLGSILANTFHTGGFQVGVLDRMDPAQIGGEVERFVGDLRDTHLLRSAISRYPRVLSAQPRTKNAEQGASAKRRNSLRIGRRSGI